MKDLTLNNISNVLGGTLYLKGEDKCIKGVAIDNRKVEEDFLFIPIKGNKVDGHTFIDAAFDAGAMCVLSEHELTEPKGSYIKVDSTEYSLKRLAAFYRTRLYIPIIGVVGSVGKTSTKEMISSVLSQRFNVLYTEGNLNNEIGLPLTLLRIRDEHDVAVCEMGISEFGEMNRLGEIAQPDMLIFTNVKECHLETLNDRDGVLKAKSEVFPHLLEGAGVFLNTDDDKLATVTEIENARIITFGTYNQNIFADQITDLGIDGVKACIHGTTFCEEVHIHIPGRHNIYHALAAAAVGEYMGLTKEEIIGGIENVKSIGGRSNIIKANNNISLIDDCYNASPASVKSALELLSKSKGEKIAILGDMGELGTNKERLHYDIGLEESFCSIDKLIVVGELSKNIVKAIKERNLKCETSEYENKESLIRDLKEYLSGNDSKEITVLIKASHFMGFSEIVDALQA